MSEDRPLSENLSEYRKALEEEYSNKSTEASEVVEARESLRNLLPEATRALEAILIGGESESVRLSAIKMVFEQTLGKPGTGTAEDEMQRLVNSLMADKSKKNQADKAK